MRFPTIRSSALLLLLAACAPQHSAGQPVPEVSFRVADRDPSGRAAVSLGQPLYLRITYTSNVPVRFRAKAYAAGEPVERGAAYNPAPAYPAGEGEGLAWIWFTEAVRIDEIRVTALDERWQDIASDSYSADVSWNDVVPRRRHAAAAWAERLSDEQQLMSSPKLDAGGGDILGGLLVSVMGLSIPAYLLLQAYMLLRFRNGWHKAAMIPLIGMIPLALYTVAALFAGSNLWPLGLLFFTPLALGYLIVLGAARFVIPRGALS